MGCGTILYGRAGHSIGEYGTLRKKDHLGPGVSTNLDYISRQCFKEQKVKERIRVTGERWLSR